MLQKYGRETGLLVKSCIPIMCTAWRQRNAAQWLTGSSLQVLVDIFFTAQLLTVCTVTSQISCKLLFWLAHELGTFLADHIVYGGVLCVWWLCSRMQAWSHCRYLHRTAALLRQQHWMALCHRCHLTSFHLLQAASALSAPLYVVSFSTLLLLLTVPVLKAVGSWKASPNNDDFLFLIFCSRAVIRINTLNMLKW